VQTLNPSRHLRTELGSAAALPIAMQGSVCRNGFMVVSNPTQGRLVGQAPIGHVRFGHRRDQRRLSCRHLWPGHLQVASAERPGSGLGL